MAGSHGMYVMPLDVSPALFSAAGRFTDYTYDTCGRLSSERVGLNEPVRVTDPVTGASSWEEPTRWAVTTLVYDAASAGDRATHSPRRA